MHSERCIEKVNVKAFLNKILCRISKVRGLYLLLFKFRLIKISLNSKIFFFQYVVTVSNEYLLSIVYVAVYEDL